MIKKENGENNENIASIIGLLNQRDEFSETKIDPKTHLFRMQRNYLKDFFSEIPEKLKIAIESQDKTIIHKKINIQLSKKINKQGRPLVLLQHLYQALYSNLKDEIFIKIFKIVKKSMFFTTYAYLKNNPLILGDFCKSITDSSDLDVVVSVGKHFCPLLNPLTPTVLNNTISAILNAVYIPLKRNFSHKYDEKTENRFLFKIDCDLDKQVTDENFPDLAEIIKNTEELQKKSTPQKNTIFSKATNLTNLTSSSLKKIGSSINEKTKKMSDVFSSGLLKFTNSITHVARSRSSSTANSTAGSVENTNVEDNFEQNLIKKLLAEDSDSETDSETDIDSETDENFSTVKLKDNDADAINYFKIFVEEFHKQWALNSMPGKPSFIFECIKETLKEVVGDFLDNKYIYDAFIHQMAKSVILSEKNNQKFENNPDEGVFTFNKIIGNTSSYMTNSAQQYLVKLLTDYGISQKTFIKEGLNTLIDLMFEKTVNSLNAIFIEPPAAKIEPTIELPKGPLQTALDEWSKKSFGKWSAYFTRIWRVEYKKLDPLTPTDQSRQSQYPLTPQ